MDNPTAAELAHRVRIFISHHSSPSDGLSVQELEELEQAAAMLETQAERLNKYRDMLPCCECDGLYKVALLLPSSADPASLPICRPCADNERLRAANKLAWQWLMAYKPDKARAALWESRKALEGEHD